MALLLSHGHGMTLHMYSARVSVSLCACVCVCECECVSQGMRNIDAKILLQRSSGFVCPFDNISRQRK